MRSMYARRVVVTGLGILSPLGCGVDVTWQNLVNGVSAIKSITRFDTTEHACKIGAPLPHEGVGAFDPEEWWNAKDRRRSSDFVIYAFCATQQALESAHWFPKTPQEREETGIIIGSGIGGLHDIAGTAIRMHENTPRIVNPFFVPANIINAASGYLSAHYGFEGPNQATVTACSTSSHAIADAARLIGCGEADVIIAGGAEAALCPLGIAGFDACRALTRQFNDRPQEASRPFDTMRSGFVMGEGAAVFVLESYEHAKKRNAPLYAEVLSHGLSGDAYHMTSPHPNGRGAARAMKMAVERANLSPTDIDYINAHGTSTPAGDEIELRAIEEVFGQNSNLVVSSTKGATGHLLGAAGALESAFCILAMKHSIIPPTLNLENPCLSTSFKLLAKSALKKSTRYALNNSFGFGGTNVSLVFSRDV